MSMHMLADYLLYLLLQDYFVHTMVLGRTLCAHMLFLQGTCSACDLDVVFSKSDKLTYMVFQVLQLAAFLMSWHYNRTYVFFHVYTSITDMFYVTHLFSIQSFS